MTYSTSFWMVGKIEELLQTINTNWTPSMMCIVLVFVSLNCPSFSSPFHCGRIERSGDGDANLPQEMTTALF